MEDDIQLDKENLDDSVLAEEHAQESVKKLKEKLKEAEAKAKEYLDGWQRERAEIANARKRDEEGKREFVKFATEGLVIEILSVLDSFDMAGGHASTSSAQAAHMEPVRKQLLSILENQGLKVLDPLGQEFDPREHESIGVVETSKSEEDHKILEVVQKGYILSGKIIRPAKVRIGELSSR